MKNSLSYLRYWLEFIAFPMFFLLVSHLIGHGVTLFFNHDHAHEYEIHKTVGHSAVENFIENFFTLERLIGFVGAIIIFFIWQKTKLKKFIPCNHEHCHAGTKWWHIGATIALCAHFFPEAILRQELLSENLTAPFAAIGFFSHFFIDIFVAISVSKYWKRDELKIISFISIAIMWAAAMFLTRHFQNILIPETLNGAFHILSGFILGMFVHLPHKPKICKKCTH